MIRRRAEADLKRRFADLGKAIREILVSEDALGLMTNMMRGSVTTNAPSWKSLTNPDKIKAFREWLESQLGEKVLGKTEEEVWQKYVEEGLKKGAGRAFDDVKKTERALTYGDDRKLDFYEGSKAQFLETSFNHPVAVEKVKLLAGRAYTDLKGITDDMATKMVRKLTDGLVQGLSPREIAPGLAIEIDISTSRATTIARTEIIRAHAEGQLDALESMGVEEVGVAVEWATANDDRVCSQCAPLEGVVLKLEEAKGMLPRHPNAVFEGSTFLSYGECQEIVRARYAGPAVILSCNGGKYRTTIGPNHPMLTKRGMIKATEINEGDEILYDLRHDGLFPDILDVNNKQVPTCKDVFETSLLVGKDSFVSSSGSDLHGDRVFCKGEVQAVRATRGLLRKLELGIIQEVSKLLLMGSDPTPNVMSSLGSSFSGSKAINLTSPGSMSSPDPGVVADDWFVWLTVHSVYSGYFKGYAYDYSTESSLYCNNGFVVRNCRCAWIPANVGESKEGQKSSKKQVESSIRQSEKAVTKQDDQSGDWGPGKTISVSRPVSILDK